MTKTLRLVEMLQRFPARWVWAGFVLCMGFVSIAILAGVQTISHTPFLFPSLGPTAILFFFHPMSPSASPRHALIGHAIGIVCGYGALLLVGLQHAGSEMGVNMSLRRLLAVALSLGATAFFMILLKVAHAPAGATTLIISMGLITRPFYLLVLELAVILLCAQSFLFNRLAGLDYPIWAGPVDSAMEVMSARAGQTRPQERPENVRPKL